MTRGLLYRAIALLSASLALASGTPAATSEDDDLAAMADQLDAADRADFMEALDSASRCTRSRNFACSEAQLKKAAKLAHGSADKRQLAAARQAMSTEQSQAAEEARQLAELAEQERKLAEAEERLRVAEARAREAEADTEPSAVSQLLQFGTLVAQNYAANKAGAAAAAQSAKLPLADLSADRQRIAEQRAKLEAARQQAEAARLANAQAAQARAAQLRQQATVSQAGVTRPLRVDTAAANVSPMAESPPATQTQLEAGRASRGGGSSAGSATSNNLPSGGIASTPVAGGATPAGSTVQRTADASARSGNTNSTTAGTSPRAPGAPGSTAATGSNPQRRDTASSSGVSTMAGNSSPTAGAPTSKTGTPSATGPAQAKINDDAAALLRRIGITDSDLQTMQGNGGASCAGSAIVGTWTGNQTVIVFSSGGSGRLEQSSVDGDYTARINFRWTSSADAIQFMYDQDLVYTDNATGKEAYRKRPKSGSSTCKLGQALINIGGVSYAKSN
jgi:hypothetical protein